MEHARIRIKPPAPGAKCAHCGSAELSSLPTFAVGCGVAYRAIADDVVCRRCGQMGPPVYNAETSGKPPVFGKTEDGGR